MKPYIVKIDDEGDGVDCPWVEIFADGTEVAVGGRHKPEDVSVHRDLSFIRDLPERLREAWAAGRAGRDFRIEKLLRYEQKEL